MSLASRIWQRLEKHPWLTMTLAVLAQTWFTLSNRALWFSDEVRYANAYQNLAERGKWMVLSLNGQPYPDKPPVYFWFLWLIDTLTPFDTPEVFFVGVACSGLLFLYAAYFLARTLQFDRSVSLASTLILLSTFLLAALFHYSRMDLMFAALIVASHACLYRAYTGEKQGCWPLVGLVLAGVATLVKGPLGFLFPLLTTGLFLAWRGECGKLFSRQTAVGLLAMLGVIAAWVVGVVIVEGPDFLLGTVLGQQIIERATHTFHHKEPFYWYLIAFPLAWMPWSLAVFAAPVRTLFSARAWADRFKARREAGPKAFLWIMFTATFLFLSSLSGKVLVYVLPMFPPLAILTANMILANEARARRLLLLTGLLWVVSGAGLLLLGDLIPVPVPIRGLGLCAGLLLLGGVLILTVRSKGPRTGLLTVAVLVTFWLYPVGLMVGPSLSDAMSPRRQALIMRDYADKGYAPFTGRVYSGIYTYYLGRDYPEYHKYSELMEAMAGHDKVILAIRDRHWEDVRDRLPEYHVIDRQSVAGLVYYLVIKG